MIRHYMFDSHANQYTMEEAAVRSRHAYQAIKDGYPVKWDDHQGWSWAVIEFESNEEAVAFKLRYI